MHIQLQKWNCEMLQMLGISENSHGKMTTLDWTTPQGTSHFQCYSLLEIKTWTQLGHIRENMVQTTAHLSYFRLFMNAGLNRKTQ